MSGPTALLSITAVPAEYSLKKGLCRRLFSPKEYEPTSTTDCPPDPPPAYHDHSTCRRAHTGGRGNRIEKAIVHRLPRRKCFACGPGAQSAALCLARALCFALDHPGEVVYVIPGLLEPPDDLHGVYVLLGWKSPGVYWSNWRPDLIRLVFHGFTSDNTELIMIELIDIKSTMKGEIPSDEISEQHEFQLVAYYYFLTLALQEYNRVDYLCQITILPSFCLWRYFGCYSSRRDEECTDACFLQDDLTAEQLVEKLECRFEITPERLERVKRRILEEVPQELGLPRAPRVSPAARSAAQPPPTAELDELATGLSRVSLAA